MSLTQLYIYNLLDMLYWVKAIDFSGLLYSFWGHNINTSMGEVIIQALNVQVWNSKGGVLTKKYLI